VQTVIRLIDRKKKEEIVIPYEIVRTFDITLWLKRELNVEMSGKKEKLVEMHKCLTERGFKFKAPFTFTELGPVMGNRGQVLLENTGLVDSTTKREIAKILFNFVAFYVGEKTVLHPAWDAARSFIRNGTGELPFKATTGVFWDIETEHVKLKPSGTNIRIANSDKGLIGYIQLFDLMIYEVELTKESVHEAALVGFKFIDGTEPIEFRPRRITHTLYTAQFDVDLRGKAKLKIQRYGRK